MFFGFFVYYSDFVIVLLGFIIILRDRVPFFVLILACLILNQMKYQLLL